MEAFLVVSRIDLCADNVELSCAFDTFDDRKEVGFVHELCNISKKNFLLTLKSRNSLLYGIYELAIEKETFSFCSGSWKIAWDYAPFSFT
jgi:hypothetical protein